MSISAARKWLEASGVHLPPEAFSHARAPATAAPPPPPPTAPGVLVRGLPPSPLFPFLADQLGEENGWLLVRVRVTGAEHWVSPRDVETMAVWQRRQDREAEARSRAALRAAPDYSDRVRQAEGELRRRARSPSRRSGEDDTRQPRRSSSDLEARLARLEALLGREPGDSE